MSFEEAVLSAATSALDWDLPAELLPLTISNEAAFLAKVTPEQACGWDWN